MCFECLFTAISYMSTKERESFQNLSQFYTSLVNYNITVITTELQLWKIKLLSKTCIDALLLCDK